MATDLGTLTAYNNQSPTNFANQVITTFTYEQDDTNNSSTVYFTTKMWRTPTATNRYSATVHGTLTVNGTVYTYSQTSTKCTTTISALSGSLVIPHNTDGTMSFSASLSIYWHTTDRTGTYTSTATYTLPTISRTSAISISPTTANIGDTVTITTTKYLTDATDTLTWVYGTNSGSISSTSWVVPNDLYSLLPSSTSATIQVRVTTVLDGTTIGYNDATLTVNVGSSVTPTITVGTVSYTNSYTYSGTEYLLTNYTSYSVPLTYAAGTGSSLQSAVITPSRVSASYSNSTLSGKFISAGAGTATITVSDTRQTTATQTIALGTSIAYSLPSITIVDLQRCESDGTVAIDGTYAFLQVAIVASNTSINSISTVEYSYDGNTYTTLPYDNDTGYYQAVIGSGDISTTDQYMIYVTARDTVMDSLSLTTVSVSQVLSSMVMPISLYDDGSSVGVTIGRAATEGGVFRCALPATFSGTVSGESVFSGMGFELGYGLSMGGYVDFHYNDPTLSSDFSSRLQGTTEGVIYVNSIYDSFLGMGRYSRASDTSLTVTFEEDHHALVMVDSTDLWLVHNDGGTLSAGHIFGSTSATFTHTAATSTTTESMTITLTSSALITALVL